MICENFVGEKPEPVKLSGGGRPHCPHASVATVLGTKPYDKRRIQIPRRTTGVNKTNERIWVTAMYKKQQAVLL